MGSPHTSEPYYGDIRSGDLDELSTEPDYIDKCLGLYLPPELYPIDSCLPDVKWVNWRWPRYEWTTRSRDSKLNVVSQFLVHNNVVLHQLTLQNSSDQSIQAPDFKLNENSYIWDMDHVNFFYGFRTDPFRQRNAPNGRGKVVIQDQSDRLESEQGSVNGAGSDSSSVRNSTHGPSNSQAAKRDVSEKQAVASVMSVYVNGKAHDFDGDPEFERKHTIPAGETLEIVAAYKLILVSIEKKHGESDEQANWRNFLISATEADVSRILRNECQAQHDLDLSMTAPGIKVQSGQAAAPGSEPQASNVPETPSVPSPQTSQEQGKYRSNVEYLARRHLEHILSVCAVPLSPPALFQKEDALRAERQEVKIKDDERVALTCGDISGHRVCTSASL